PRPFLHSGVSAGKEADLVIQSYRVISNNIDKNGVLGLGGLIVSMTRSLSDLLVVYILAREAGLTRRTPDGLAFILPVVPLFETVSDLERSPSILKRFIEHPVTRLSVKWQAELASKHGRPARPVQPVMIGYSDSNKDAGLLTCQ